LFEGPVKDAVYSPGQLPGAWTSAPAIHQNSGGFTVVSYYTSYPVDAEKGLNNKNQISKKIDLVDVELIDNMWLTLTMSFPDQIPSIRLLKSGQNVTYDTDSSPNDYCLGEHRVDIGTSKITFEVTWTKNQLRIMLFVGDILSSKCWLALESPDFGNRELWDQYPQIRLVPLVQTTSVGMVRAVEYFPRPLGWTEIIKRNDNNWVKLQFAKGTVAAFKF
jgi:hypothetical protein